MAKHHDRGTAPRPLSSHPDGTAADARPDLRSDEFSLGDTESNGSGDIGFRFAWDSAAGVNLLAQASAEAQTSRRGHETIVGTPEADVLHGGASHDTLIGMDGGDIIRGHGGRDYISGGKGEDFLIGGYGADIIIGGLGDDTIDGGWGRDIIKGGEGNDLIYGGPDPDVIVYGYAWSEISAVYDSSTYSITVVAPDGTDQIFSALTIATTTGTYRFDVPTESWIFDANMTSHDWLT